VQLIREVMKIKRAFFAVFIFSVVFFASAFNAVADTHISEPRSNYIADPMFGKPALWLSGGEDDPQVMIDPSGMEFDLPYANAVTWTVLLRKANGPVLFEVELPVEHAEIASPYYILHLSIPEDIPVDLFDLEVSVDVGGTVYSDYQPNAVKIIDEIKDHYSIVHVTDIHVDDPRGCMANFSETAQYKLIRKMIHTVNLFNPEFVIITGDHVFGASYSREYSHLYDLLQDFDVPVFMSIGNHDAINHAYWTDNGRVDGLQAFEDLFAPLNFTFTYGTMEYISLNSMDWSAYERRGVSIFTLAIGGQMREDQLDWFEDELAAADAELILAGYHHPPHNSFQGTGADRVMLLARQYNVDAVLTGHTHVEEVKLDGDVLYLTTGSLMFNGFGGSYPAFRMLEVMDSELVSWNYEEPRWSVPVYKDSSPYCPLWNLSVSALSCTYTPANNGTSSTVTATVTNFLVKDYDGISLEFVMPVTEPGRTYDVTGGDVVDVYDTGDYQIWYVKTNVDVDSYKEVTIAEAKLPGQRAGR
jgi:predicted phosphodiesterase